MQRSWRRSEVLLGGTLAALAASAPARAVNVPLPVGATLGKRYIVNTWYTTRAYLAQNPEVVHRFLAGLIPAVTYANAHPDEMTSYLAPFVKIDESKLRAMAHSVIATTLVAGEYQPVIDAAAKYGFIDKPFPAKNFLL